MSWIKVIEYNKAEGLLKKIYDRVKGPNDKVDNVLSIHSLRPHTLSGHMTLYKNVLHNSNNVLPKWYLESIGVYVSHLNNCNYCVQHHFAGFKKLIQDDSKADSFMNAIEKDELSEYFKDRYLQGIQYAKQLTLSLNTIEKNHIDELRRSGFSDGEILEINQVTSYFNYVNRTVVGLGVSLKGDILGLSPNKSNDPNNWSHT